jgi:hypothetical protein
MQSNELMSVLENSGKSSQFPSYAMVSECLSF